MDWGMDYLKALTIELDFQKSGKTVFLATSWPGYVGVLTGEKTRVFTSSPFLTYALTLRHETWCFYLHS